MVGWNLLTGGICGNPKHSSLKDMIHAGLQFDRHLLNEQ
jgi:hypothetical protein